LFLAIRIGQKRVKQHALFTPQFRRTKPHNYVIKLISRRFNWRHTRPTYNKWSK